VEVFVARHAILDRNLSLFGYELLFRSCERNNSDITDDSSCTLQVLANALLSSGLDSITGDKLAFINFGQELLTSDWTSLLPPSSVVVEILETVRPEPEVIDSCLRLHKSGYTLALDDVTAAVQEKGKLLDVADLVKVDFRATSRDEQLHLANFFRASKKRVLAEKVESHADFTWAYEAGYDFFQGFFFAKPALLRGQHIPGVKINALRLLKEIGQPEFDFERLIDVIKCDVSLTYKLFRYVNSALFGRRQEIRSINEALLMLGEVGIRRWIALATLPALATDTPHELMVHALVRARFCELLAGKAHQQAFLVGLLSLLDAFVERRLREILPELSLPEQVNNALLGIDAGRRLCST
jgi:c-di-GMP-related signal transduction protein